MAFGTHLKVIFLCFCKLFLQAWTAQDRFLFYALEKEENLVWNLFVKENSYQTSYQHIVTKMDLLVMIFKWQTKASKTKIIRLFTLSTNKQAYSNNISI